MPSPLKWLGTGLLLRTLIAELRLLRAQLTRQANALERLAAQWAPAVEVLTPTGEAPLDSVSFVDEHEAALVEEYVAKVEREMGAPPSEEQVVDYLGDEKTVELRKRLQERADEWQLRFARQQEGKP